MGLVTVLGLTFKENVPDIRNSRVVDVIRELQSFGVPVQIHDPILLPDDAEQEYGLALSSGEALKPAEAVIFAVAHDPFVTAGWRFIKELLRDGTGIVLDVKAILPRDQKHRGIELWRL
jgi:UDP-N-acetyl-D-galactosamine dehydrogenase